MPFKHNFLSNALKRRNERTLREYYLNKSKPQNQNYFDKELLNYLMTNGRLQTIISTLLKDNKTKHPYQISKTYRDGSLDFFSRILEEISVTNWNVIDCSFEQDIITEQVLTYFTEEVSSILKRADICPYAFVETLIKQNIVITQDEIKAYTKQLQETSLWPKSFYSFQHLLSNKMPEIDTDEQLIHSVYHALRDGFVFHYFSHIGAFLEKYSKTEEGQKFLIDCDSLPPEAFLNTLFERMSNSTLICRTLFHSESIDNERLVISARPDLTISSGESQMVFNFGDNNDTLYVFQSRAQTKPAERETFYKEHYLFFPYAIGAIIDEESNTKESIKHIFNGSPLLNKSSQALKNNTIHQALFPEQHKQNWNKKIKNFFKFNNTINEIENERILFKDLEKLVDNRNETLPENEQLKASNYHNLHNLLNTNTHTDNIIIEHSALYPLENKSPFEKSITTFHQQTVPQALYQLCDLIHIKLEFSSAEKAFPSILSQCTTKRIVDRHAPSTVFESETIDQELLEQLIVEHFVLSDIFSMTHNYKRLLDYQNESIIKGLMCYIERYLFSLNDHHLNLFSVIERHNFNHEQPPTNIINNLAYCLKQSFYNNPTLDMSSINEVNCLTHKLDLILKLGIQDYEYIAYLKAHYFEYYINLYKNVDSIKNKIENNQLEEIEEQTLRLLHIFCGEGFVSRQELDQYFSDFLETEQLLEILNIFEKDHKN